MEREKESNDYRLVLTLCLGDQELHIIEASSNILV